MTVESTTGRVRDLLGPLLGSTAEEVVVASGHEDVLREAVLALADAVAAAEGEANGDGDGDADADVDEDGESDGDADGDGGAPDRVRLLGTERALDAASDHFLAASRAVDLVDAGRLSLHATGEAHLASVVVTAAEGDDPSRRADAAGAVTSLAVLPGGDAVALRTGEADAVSAARTAFEGSLAGAGAYEVAVPGYSRLLESLEAAVGPDVRGDVEHVLADGVGVRCSVSGVDEIDTVLLLGGRNGAQLFELSEWAEELGVASRATMSSRKRQLEAAGLLTTEKVRADVGRPRQRLLLAADDLRDAPPSDVVRTARSVLADG